MKITRASIPTRKVDAETFTGDVYVDTIPAEEANLVAVVVHFAPGARTAWHTHPLGQTLFITEGVGRVQREGGEIEEVRAGDSVFFEPGENHWHGASPDRFMAHIAIVREPESEPGTHWGRLVTDEEYQRQAEAGL